MFTDVRAFTRAAFSKESTVDTTKEEEGGASVSIGNTVSNESTVDTTA